MVYGNTDDDLMGVRGDTVEEMHANASLIAAAPELLDALIALTQFVELNTGLITSELIKAKQAIAKATGNQ